MIIKWILCDPIKCVCCCLSLIQIDR